MAASVAGSSYGHHGLGVPWRSWLQAGAWRRRGPSYVVRRMRGARAVARTVGGSVRAKTGDRIPPEYGKWGRGVASHPGSRILEA